MWLEIHKFVELLYVQVVDHMLLGKKSPISRPLYL